MDLITLEYSEMIDGKLEKKRIEFSKSLLIEPYRLKSLFVIKVDGQSMQPLIHDKALVVADLSQIKMVDKSIYLIYKDNMLWIKQAKVEENKSLFVSINEEFSHLVYKYEEVRVVAKVLLTFTTL